MLRASNRMARTLALMVLVTLGAAVAGSPDIDWYTIDSGGEMFCTGGQFILSGTIGQPDASVETLTGGGYKLTGGFWTPVVGGPVPVTPGEVEPSDEPTEPTEPQPAP